MTLSPRIDRSAPTGRVRPGGAEKAASAHVGSPPGAGPSRLPAPLRRGFAAPLGGSRGAYDRGGRRLANLSLLVALSPIALGIGLPITLVNAVLFRGLRRAFYTQPRVGKDGVVFRIWKFRTMRAASPAEDYRSWSAGEDDLRVTAFGRLLRNTHLDELPQLVNVLLGNMAFVGPRPEMVEIHGWACERIPGFAQRTLVEPGITGLAQVSQGYTGPDEEAYARKLATDMAYVRARSLVLDARILLRTVFWMLGARGWRGPALRSEAPGRGDAIELGTLREASARPRVRARAE